MSHRDARPKLVPEFACRDALLSQKFYTDVLGFSVRYDRPDKGFFFLERQGAEIMIEQIKKSSWFSAPATAPFGRGMSLQIMVTDLADIYKSCQSNAAPIFRDWEEAWYRAGDRYLGQAQFIVADPDGYLLRFAQDLGSSQELPTTGRVVS